MGIKDAEKNKKGEADESEGKPTITLDEDDGNDDEAGDEEGEEEGDTGDESGGDDESGEGDGQAGDDDADEVQIVREGDTQAPAGTPRGFLKRINKLNGRVDAAKGETDQFRERNLHLEDINKVQKMRIEQLEGAPPAQPLVKPDPEKFTEGIYDDGYIKAFDEYQDKKLDARFDERIAKQTKQSNVTSDQSALALKLRQRQEAHIDRAQKLKVKDYEATEDITLSIMGHDKVNHIILALPDKTELIMYYLGKNPDVAQKYSAMLEAEPIRALIELGGILSEIKVKPSSKKTLKDPDEDLEGGNLPRDKKKRGPKGATFT
jgi:hypothetical protein